MIPDYNRDGKIDDLDRHQVTDRNPLRWWVNDDRDEGDIADSSDDIPTGRGANYQNTIPAISDLVDYFPIRLDIKPLLDLYPPSEFTYMLRHGENALQFVETTLESSNTRAYLSDYKFARELVGRGLRVIWSSGTVISDDFLSKVHLGNVDGVILIGGARTSDRPLEFVVAGSAGEVVSDIFELNLSSVESMYRWLNLRGVRSWDPDNRTALGASTKRTNIAEEPPNRPDIIASDRHFVFYMDTMLPKNQLGDGGGNVQALLSARHEF